MVDDLAWQRARARCTSVLAVGVSAIVLLAGCGSGSSGSESGSTAAPAKGSGAPAALVGPVAVAQATGPLGVYLVDGAGRTLYLFEADTGGVPSCIDACTTTWPPMIAAATPTADAGIPADKLATVARSDGSNQVRFAEHPLYYFTGDQQAGQTNGQGNSGQWWIVGPDGNPIKSGAEGAGGGNDVPGGGY